MTDYQSAIAKLYESLEQIPRSEVPLVLGELERIKAVLWADFMSAGKGQAQETLLDMTDVATRLKIPISRAYELVRQGKLPGVRVGKYVRVRQTVLKEYEASLATA
jgi:excisionase family DNA binding protein